MLEGEPLTPLDEGDERVAPAWCRGAHIPPSFRAPRTVVASPSPVPIVPLSSIDVRHASSVPSLLSSPPFPLPAVLCIPTRLTT
ncbi:hypothetical protein ACI65C_008369 [Semiaphis heraclei]